MVTVGFSAALTPTQPHVGERPEDRRVRLVLEGRRDTRRQREVHGQAVAQAANVDEEHLAPEPTDGVVVAQHGLVQGDRPQAPAEDKRQGQQAGDGEARPPHCRDPVPGADPPAGYSSVFSISAIFCCGKRGSHSSPSARHSCTCASAAWARSGSSRGPLDIRRLRGEDQARPRRGHDVHQP